MTRAVFSQTCTNRQKAAKSINKHTDPPILHHVWHKPLRFKSQRFAFASFLFSFPSYVNSFIMSCAETSEQGTAQSIRKSNCPLYVCVFFMPMCTCKKSDWSTLLVATEKSSCDLCLSHHFLTFYPFLPIAPISLSISSFLYSFCPACFHSSNLLILHNPPTCSSSFQCSSLLLTSTANPRHLSFFQSFSSLATSETVVSFMALSTVRLPFIFCTDT